MQTGDVCRRVVVPATGAALARVNELLREQAERAGLSGEGLGRLRLSVEEIFVNIVEHGQSAGQTVVVETGRTGTAVWVRLTDRTPRFDPAAWPEPPGLDLPLSCRDMGGLGIFLARRSADVLRHRYRTGANRTLVAVRTGPAPS